MATKKIAKTSRVNKAAFIRSLPTSLSGKEVVKRAKASGIDISIRDVHRITSQTRVKATATVARAIATDPKLLGRTVKSASVPSRRPAVADKSAVRAIERVAERKVIELVNALIAHLRSFRYTLATAPPDARVERFRTADDAAFKQFLLALRAARGNVSHAAASLGISRARAYRLLGARPGFDVRSLRDEDER